VFLRALTQKQQWDTWYWWSLEEPQTLLLEVEEGEECITTKKKTALLSFK
jgi:hypothetical protein